MLPLKVSPVWVALRGVLRKFLRFDKVGYILVACPCFLRIEHHRWLTLGAMIVLGTTRVFNFGFFMHTMLDIIIVNGGCITCGSDPIGISLGIFKVIMN